MGSRARLWYSAETDNGSAESIDLDEKLPFNAELLQFSISFEAEPVSSDLFSVVKDSVLGVKYNMIIDQIDLSQNPTISYKCTGLWQFRKGDGIIITYANTDDQSVGVEAVFREAK